MYAERERYVDAPQSRGIFFGDSQLREFTNKEGRGLTASWCLNLFVYVVLFSLP